mmetsp:Transcript_22735/g.57926  ORF Transcript_22735/g.57926 Transcript_22735/m.57926 type:complete len:240 (+) Transcript_22735:42-761(+)
MSTHSLMQIARKLARCSVSDDRAVSKQFLEIFLLRLPAHGQDPRAVQELVRDRIDQPRVGRQHLAQRPSVDVGPALVRQEQASALACPEEGRQPPATSLSAWHQGMALEHKAVEALLHGGTVRHAGDALQDQNASGGQHTCAGAQKPQRLIGPPQPVHSKNAKASIAAVPQQVFVRQAIRHRRKERQRHRRSTHERIRASGAEASVRLLKAVRSIVADKRPNKQDLFFVASSQHGERMK